MILTKISYAGNSQSIPDTICLPMADARKVLADARQKPVLQERIKLLQDDIALLNARIVEKEKIIAAYESKEANNAAIITLMQEQKDLLVKERDLHKEQVLTMEKMLRKEKRKRWWTAAGGFLSTAGAMYLFITK